MKSIRNYIFRTDIKEADIHAIHAKKIKIKKYTTERKSKTLMEGIAEQLTLFTQQHVKYMVTFILATLVRRQKQTR